MKKFFLPGFIFLIIMAGCKKDDNCDINSERLVGSYKLTALTYKPAGSTTSQDVYASFVAPCERDDLYIFNSNNTFNYVDAGTVCIPAGNYNATWALSGNVLTYDGDSFTVASFDCSTMVVSISDPSFPGDVYTFTFARQ